MQAVDLALVCYCSRRGLILLFHEFISSHVIGNSKPRDFSRDKNGTSQSPAQLILTLSTPQQIFENARKTNDE